MAENKEVKSEETKEQPKVDNEVGKIKVKKPKAKKFKEPEDGISKINLKELAEKGKEISKVDSTNEENTSEESKIEETPKVEETLKVEENIESTEEKPILEEIKVEENKEAQKITETASEAITKSIETGRDLPESVQKLINFMDETGGDVHDYVKLNRDYSKMDNHTLLKEYYKESKPHLSSEEVDFLMEDKFSYDEEEDNDRDIKRKKLALKEQVADARKHLDGLKSKYYEDIKAGSKLTGEQKEAIDFFNRYKKEEAEGKEESEKRSKAFKLKTDELFNNNFKGFEYNVGDKNFRFNIKNADEIKNTQSDISNFTKKFLDKNNTISDAQGYHKSLYTAMNADAIAKHFYEQGKSDAIKESMNNAKNINMDPRQSHGGDINTSGMKVKVLGDNSADFKFKIKKQK